MNIVVNRFTVTPQAVAPGESVTVAWKVTVPDTGEDFQLRLNGNPITSFGQRSFRLMETTDFRLSAVTNSGERVLRSSRTRVDQPDCKWAPQIDAYAIELIIERPFNERFSKSDQFKLREGETAVTLGDGMITVAVPLKILVENWFNASMDLSLKLSVQAGSGSPVVALLRDVDLNVSWTFFENLASLGCTSLVGKGMSRLGTVLFREIVESEVVPTIATAFNSKVNQFLAQAKTEDSANRSFSLVFFELSAAGVKYKVCPAA